MTRALRRGRLVSLRENRVYPGVQVPTLRAARGVAVVAELWWPREGWGARVVGCACAKDQDVRDLKAKVARHPP